jgi:hypothetical protein
MLQKAILDFPQDHRFQRLEGIRLLKAGDHKAALAAFAASLKLKAGQQDLQAVQAVFAKEPQVVSFVPTGPPGAGDKVLARSARPLMGAVFRTHTGPVLPFADDVQLRLDGRLLQPIFWGSEALFLSDRKLSDGAHTLEAEVKDLLGRKARGKFTFQVDDSPPEITSTVPPDGGKVKGPRPKLVINYADKYSGVDASSVEVEMRSDRGASTWFAQFVVKGGRYTFSYSDAARGIKFKEGDPVGKDKLVFTAPRNLGIGTYKVTFTVGDVRGLKVKKDWKFTVVK